MSYEPTTWQCGDVITADKLNNIEDGIEQALECCGGGSEPLVVTSQLGVLDKTWQEINDAFPNICFYDGSVEKIAITSVRGFGALYEVSLASGDVFSATNANDYPSSDK